MSALLAIALLFSALAGEPGTPPEIDMVAVRLGYPRVSIGCDRHPAIPLLREVARRAGLGFRDDADPTGASEGPLLTVDLVRRSLPEAIEIVAGAAGRSVQIENGTIVLLDESAGGASGSFPRLRNRAIEAYRKAIVSLTGHPATRRAHLEIGKLLDTDGSSEAAAEEYAAYLREYPADDGAPEARLRLGRIYAHLGREQEARAQLLTLIEFHPASAFAPEAALEVAESFDRAGEVLRAIDLLRSVVNGVRAPGNVLERALERLVRLLLEHGEPDSALAALDDGQRAIGADAAPPHRLVLLRSQVLLEAGNADAAIPLLLSIPSGAPEASRAKLLAGRSIRLRGDPLGAISTLRDARRFARDPAESIAATLELGRAYEDACLDRLAKELYESEIQGMKGYRSARAELEFALAESLLRSGECERARQLFTELKRESPFTDRALYGEAACHLRLGEPARARESLLSLLQKPALVGVERDAVAVLLASALSRMSEPRSATAAREDPDR